MKRLSIISLVVIIISLFAFGVALAAPYGPSVNVEMQSSATVGDTVPIRIHVNSDNPGACQVVTSCDGTNKSETSERDFIAEWRTSSCSAGTQSVTITCRDKDDLNWENPNTHPPIYIQLNPAPQAPVAAPEASFWADSNEITVGQCTNIHWRTTNANTVNIDGENVDLNGDRQVCPSVTKRYSLRASGLGGDKTPVFEIVVRQVGGGNNNNGNNGGDNNGNNQPASGGNSGDGNSDNNGNSNTESNQTAPSYTGCSRAPATQLSVGGQAQVTTSGGLSLHLRESASSVSPKVRDLENTVTVDVIDGPVCNEGYRWWYVQYNSNTKGWLADGVNGNVWLIPYGAPPADPTAAPSNDQSSSDNDSSSNNESNSTEEKPWYCFIPLLCGVDQAEAWNTTCDPQCVPYVRKLRPDTKGWAKSGTGMEWLGEIGTDNELIYTDQSGNKFKIRIRSANETPQAGDIIVWKERCSGAGTSGHVGYVNSYSNGSVYVKDSNWGSENCHERTNAKVEVLNCMRFITSPETYINSGVNQPSSNQGCISIKPWWMPKLIFLLLHPECK